MKEKGINLGWLSDYRNELYGFAILWIMVFHGFDWNRFDYAFTDLLGADSLLHQILLPIRAFFQIGNGGVDLFLLLSGMSLYFSFQKNQNILTFYKKRYLKLYPTLWLIFGTWWALSMVRNISKGEGVFISIAKFFSKMTQTSFWFGNDKNAWFVAAIAVFYFGYPFLYHFFYDNPKKTCSRFWISFIFLMVSLVFISFGYPEIWKRMEIALTRFPAFVLGCGMAKMIYERKTVSKVFYVVPFALLVGIYFIYSRNLPMLKTINCWRYLLGLMGISAGICMVYVFRLISWKPFHSFFKFFGNMSLELYLSHSVLHKWYLFLTHKEGHHIHILEYYTVLLVSILLAYVVMKLTNRLLKKKPAKVQG